METQYLGNPEVARLEGTPACHMFVYIVVCACSRHARNFKIILFRSFVPGLQDHHIHQEHHSQLTNSNQTKPNTWHKELDAVIEIDEADTSDYGTSSLLRVRKGVGAGRVSGQRAFSIACVGICADFWFQIVRSQVVLTCLPRRLIFS